MDEAMKAKWALKKYKVTELKGDVNKFIQDLGFPNMAMVAEEAIKMNLGPGTIISFQADDGMVRSTVHGVVMDNVQDPLPSDGTPVESKNIFGEVSKKSATFVDSDTLEMIGETPQNTIKRILKKDGDTKMSLEMIVVKTGTSFTTLLELEVPAASSSWSPF